MTYFVPQNPTSNEHSTYERSPITFFWTKSGGTWVWRFDSSFTPQPTQRARMLVDGQPGPWVLPDAKGYYPFPLSLPNGHHVASAEVEGASPEVLAKGFTMNDSGIPLLVQAPWTAANRFDRHYTKIANTKAHITYPGALPAPKTFPFKPRLIEPYRALLPKNQLWVRHCQANVGAAMTRRFVALPTGDVDIEADQLYFYGDATTFSGHKVGQITPKVTLRDGPRGVGTLGFVYKIRISPRDTGFYFSDTSGRLGFCSWAGVVTTLVGWRIKPGELKAHAGIRSPHYMYGASAVDKRPEHQTFYDSKWEHLGDWAQVPGNKRSHEWWGFDQFDGHEFWIADTLNHRILYADHNTAHSHSTFHPASYPPAGYIQASGPTGQTTMALFIGNPDGTPSQYVNQPWGVARNPVTGEITWTNFGNGSICRANADGSNPRFLLQSAIPIRDRVHTAGKRLDISFAPIADTRAQYLRDGPIGVASCVCPQDIEFTSDGKLVWCERYTFAVRKLDEATGAVSTVALNPRPESGSTSASTNDASISIDTEGSCGPVDDIFYNAWHNSDHRFGIDGTYRGRPLWTSGSSATMRNGPLSRCDAPGYAWAIAVGNGRIVAKGNAAGSQFMEVTKRQPGDPEPDFTKWTAGRKAYNDSGLALLHGPDGQGELGLSNMEEWGSWTDAEISAFVLAAGMPQASVVNFISYVRSSTVDHDYSTTPNDAPAAPSQPLTVKAIDHV
jgi:hypothetical protein